MKILINAGHSLTGADHGAIGKSGLWEAEVNANIASFIKKHLEGSVLFQQNKSLNEVIKFANENNFDFAISIHCNASTNREANGVETLYYPTSAKGKNLAGCIQNELVKITKLRDRGLKTRSDLGFLKRIRCVSVLVECAFISNPKEEQMLKNNYSMFAQGIVNGILAYIKGCTS